VTMQVARLTAPAEFVLTEMDVPAPQRGEVLIRVTECGICGSDLKMYLGHHPVLKPPMILGHEFYGVVEASAADGITPGTVVSSFPPVGCGRCPACQRGEPHLCEAMEVIGGQRHGGLSEFVTVPATNVVPIDGSVPAWLRVLIEPLAVGVHAAARAQASPDDLCVVFGAGPIGLFTALALQRSGVRQVAITDLSQTRLDLARRLGVTHTLAATIDAAELRTALSRPAGVDVAMECVGSNATVDLGLQATRKGGKVVLVGVEPEQLTVHGPSLQREERSLIGVQMYGKADFQIAAELLASGLIPDGVAATDLFSQFRLDQVGEAFRLMRAGQLTGLKTVITVGQPEGPA
jgi:threonine dehydrogenase-like Zn-dependent dehydrogenase